VLHLAAVNPVLAGRCVVEGRACQENYEVLEQVVKSLVATMRGTPPFAKGGPGGVALRVRIAAGRVAGELGAWLATLSDGRRALKDLIPGMTDAPEMVDIPAGEFWMGTSKAEAEICRRETGRDPWEDEYPQHPVTLRDYALGRYPVTNYQFGRFVAAGGYKDPRWWESHWEVRQEEGWEQPEYWDDPRRRRPNDPVVGISWYEARAYARWLAEETGEPYRLPTEAEWERAARGLDRRVWPWGNDWNSTRCNVQDGEHVGALTPVGMYPTGASPDGCEEMIGNVWEWCASEWAKYPFNVNNDINNEITANNPLLRGASWSLVHPQYARAAFRNHYDGPRTRHGSDGARLARGL
jgi:formylglycine-generating enzyme required for sulfatase activity